MNDIKWKSSSGSSISSRETDIGTISNTNLSEENKKSKFFKTTKSYKVLQIFKCYKRNFMVSMNDGRTHTSKGYVDRFKIFHDGFACVLEDDPYDYKSIDTQIKGVTLNCKQITSIKEYAKRLSHVHHLMETTMYLHIFGLKIPFKCTSYSPKWEWANEDGSLLTEDDDEKIIEYILKTHLDYERTL